MRKFYTVLAMAFIALAVSAQDAVTKFVKLTEEPADWCGEYLIVYEADDVNNVAYVFNGSLDALDAKGNFFEAENPKEMIGSEEVRIIDANVVTEGATFTVTRNSDDDTKYSIQSKSGLYIGYNSTEPDPETGQIEPNLKESLEKQYPNSITLEPAKSNVIVTAKNGFELRFNNDAGKQRFRYHASGKKKAIKFYKKVTITSTPTVTADNQKSTSDIYEISGSKATNRLSGNIYVGNGKKFMVK